MLTSKLVCTFVLAYLSAAALAVEAPPAAAAPPPAVAPSVPSSPVPKPINVASTEVSSKSFSAILLTFDSLVSNEGFRR